jgi:iron(III) transport system ATP-binding protein
MTRRGGAVAKQDSIDGDEVLRLDDVRVGYALDGAVRMVVDGLSLSLRAGQIGALLGASGCGKTTALRAIAGFEPVRGGRIVLRGTAVADAATSLAPEQRRVGMVFQDYALFPHLDVRGNVGFGLQRGARDRAARVDAMLALVGLPERARAYPHELSGGQQQRVALARALAPGPALLLLDEPFSNLDAGGRQRLAGELRALLKDSGTTALMVTHDQGEAFAMADAIGVMGAGRLHQWADAATLYRAPADRFVAGFIGRGHWVSGAMLGLAHDVEARLRPGDLLADPAGPIRAQVESMAFQGPHHLARIRFADGSAADAELEEAHGVAPGSELRFRLRGTPSLFAREPNSG